MSLLYTTLVEHCDLAARLTSSQSVVLILHPSGGDRSRVEGLALLGALAAMRRGVDSFAGNNPREQAEAMAMSSVLRCIATEDRRLRERVLGDVTQRLLQICCPLKRVADLRDQLPVDCPQVWRTQFRDTGTHSC